MEKTFDNLIYYTDFNNKKCHCHLELFTKNKSNSIAVCTEMSDNPGAAVTASWPSIYLVLNKTFGCTATNTLFVEHYSDATRKDDPQKGIFATVDIYDGEGFWAPSWKRLEGQTLFDKTSA